MDVLRVLVCIALIVVSPINAAKELQASAVYLNGSVYTVDDNKPRAQAFAIADKRFIAVGMNSEIDRYIGAKTTVVDLGGKMVIPGIHDAHTHLLDAAFKFGGYSCVLPYPEVTPKEIISALKQCMKTNPARPGNWIKGGVLSDELFNSTELQTLLNTEFPKIPIVLEDLTTHHVLANISARHAAGITEDTPDPSGGKLGRNDKGLLTGQLIELASELVYKVMPPYPEDENTRALLWSISLNNRFGVTSVEGATVSRSELQALNKLDNKGELTLRVFAYLLAGNSLRGSEEENAQLISERNDFATAHIDVNNAKLFLDGAPLPPNSTHSMIDLSTNEIDQTHMLFEQDELERLVIDLDSRGLKIKLHAAGTGSFRAALDAIEAARKKNGMTRLHDIAHAHFIHPADVDRIGPLGVVPELSPAVWHFNPPMNEHVPAWQFRTLADHDIMVVIGTDWLVDKQPNLFPALQGMLQHGDEAVDLETALHMMTINGAISVGKEDEFGSITPGKSADFAVLNQNLFQVPVDKIRDTEVLMTVFEGGVVYEQK
jgi:predicted amidohydrolase YtcJ